MKIIRNYILFIIALMFVGISTVKAVDPATSVTALDVNPFSAEVKITGKNYYKRELKAEITSCTGAKNCYLSDVKWFYNDTESTEGGTEIPSTVDENRYYPNYYVEESLIGKYIYIEAKVYGEDNENHAIKNGNNETIILNLKDITDTVTNSVAKSGKIELTNSLNVDNVKFKTTYNSGAGSSLDMKVDGITNSEGVNYNIFFAKTKADKPIITQKSSGCDIDDGTTFKDNVKYTYLYDDGKVSVPDQWFMLKDFNYVYIVKSVKDTTFGGFYCEMNAEPLVIAKPDLQTFGNRYQYFLFSNEHKTLSTFPFYPYGWNSSDALETTTMTTKIGVVTDKELLKKIAKKEAGALNDLLDYAKKAAGKTFNYNQGDFDINIDDFEVTNGSYYYIYNTVNDPEGIYRDLDDVTLVMAELGMLVNDLKWDPSYTETTTDEEPESGEIDVPGEGPEGIPVVEIIYEDGGGKDGIEQMEEDAVYYGDLALLAYNQYEWLNPKKRTFLGWKVYIEDVEGNRSEVLAANGNVLTLEEGEVFDTGSIEIPSGAKLILVASWAPPTGYVLPALLSLLLLGIGGFAAITYTKSKKSIVKL
jgi:hypothetical protein